MFWSLLDLAGRCAVAVAFAWAAVGKLADLPGLRATLYLSRLTRPWVPQLSIGLPVVELVLAGGLLGARSGGFAALASAVLLVAFVAYLGLDPAAGQGCNCFGGRTTSSRRAGIVRDLLLLAALGPALVHGPALGPALSRSLAGPHWGMPAAAEPGAAALAAAVIAGTVGWATRRDARTRRPGRRRVGVPTVTPLAVRREAVPFEVTALDGRSLRLADLAARPGGVLVVFTEPGCVLCEALLPELAARSDVVVLAAVLDAAVVPGWALDHGLAPARVAPDLNGAIADAYGIRANPAACRVDASGLLVDAAGLPTPRPSTGADAVRALLPLPRS